MPKEISVLHFGRDDKVYVTKVEVPTDEEEKIIETWCNQEVQSALEKMCSYSIAVQMAKEETLDVV